MKKLILYVLSFIVLVNTQGYSDELIEFTIDEMTPAAFDSFRKGDLAGILRLERGNKFPVKVSIEGDIVSLSDETSPFFNFQVGKKVYITYKNGSFVFSNDKQTWEGFEEYFKGMVDLDYGEGNLGPVKLSMKNFKKGKFDRIVQLDKGAMIPLVLSIKGDLFSFSETSPLVHIEVSKSLYIKMQKGDVLFSLDQENWMTAQEQFKGMLNVALAQEEIGLLGNQVVK